MARTYRLSEKELLTMGFSKVAARALRYVFEAIGDGDTPDLTLVEVNDILKDLAYTSSATSLLQPLLSKIIDLQNDQARNEGSRITELEKRINDLEKRFAAGY